MTRILKAAKELWELLGGGVRLSCNEFLGLDDSANRGKSSIVWILRTANSPELELPSMRSLLACFVQMFFVMIAQIDDTQEPSAQDLATIQGSWELIQEIVEGAPMVYKGLDGNLKRREVWTITEDRIARRIELNELGKTGAFTSGSEFQVVRIDRTQKPHRIELKASGGDRIPLSVEGMVYPAIFMIDKDVLTICMPTRARRPTEFVSGKGSEQRLCLFNRLQDCASDAREIVAAGDWSKPVADTRGYAVRGRLVL